MPIFNIGNSVRSLADEAELQALTSDTGTYSLEDLKAALRHPGESGDSDEAEGGGGDDRVTLLADDASQELYKRADILGEAYPFSIGGGVLSHGDRDGVAAYIFLLLASMPAYNEQRVGAIYFEKIVADALSRYIDGRALRFGWPNRAPVPTNPGDAVDYLATQIAERRNHLGHIRSRDKDMGLDAVAWKPFPDQRRGQVVLLGQCATGSEWRNKIGDLSVNRWLQFIAFTVTPILLFAIPWIPDEDDWALIQDHGFLVFDRIRAVASLGKWSGDPDVDDWCRKRLRETTAVQV